MRRGTSGFTLLEILLSIFLVAVVMSICYGIVASTIKADGRITELTHGSEIGPAVLTQIRADVDAAFLPDKETEYFKGTDQKGYSGDRDRLDFVSSVVVFGADQPMAEPRFHSVNEIGYQLKDSPEHDGEGILYRRVDPFLDAEPTRGGNLTLVCDRVLSFNVEYWNGTQWISTWLAKQNDDKLPSAVKVELKLRIPDRQSPSGVSDRLFSTILPLVR